MLGESDLLAFILYFIVIRVVLQENIEIFGALVREVRKTTRADGVHLMAVGFEWIVPKVIEKSGKA